MKTIVIGPSLSGKTTIIRELRKTTNIPVSEMDAMLTEANNGDFPSDIDYKNTVLAPKVIADILSKEEIIFFTNTNYFSLEDLQRAKEKGFKIVILDMTKEELIKRNNNRVKNEHYQDQSQWLDGMLKYQNNLIEKGLVDQKLDGSQSINQIISDLLK
jgi:adenylate kinase family enzyme